jgi:hypothetical protein
MDMAVEKWITVEMPASLGRETSSVRRRSYVVAARFGAVPSPKWFSDEFHRLAADAAVPRHGSQTIDSLMGRRGHA